MINENTIKNACLGIELGSTRIKAVLIDQNQTPIASGDHVWENKLIDGNWTYSLEDVKAGLQTAYKKLKKEVQKKYDITITNLGAIGISAMMHGYLAFDKDDNLLVPFRTWRNTNTEKAAVELTELLSFNIPQRWSIAHLYQAILDDEPHVKDIKYITTLAGYVHKTLTGENVLGVGDASGMFPIDSKTNDYNAEMIDKYDKAQSAKHKAQILDVLPKVLNAGDNAGTLTENGALFIDPTGDLQAGIPFCPPEGDAGTGMVATNSVAVKTGNVSAGTSIFAMLVLEQELSKVYMEIDMVTTSAGKPVAMVHCNNCTTDFDAWIKLLRETLALFGSEIPKPEVYDAFYQKALYADEDCGGLLSYNYIGGEPITGILEGRPLFVRTPDSKFNLANLSRTLLFSIMGTLKIGMDILTQNEKVEINTLLGHGGLFKTPVVGQKIMASALGVPVSVMESAGEGGAWGIAVLADYMKNKNGETLEAYLNDKVFAKAEGSTENPDADIKKSFDLFMEKYIKGLEIEKSAVQNFS